MKKLLYFASAIALMAGMVACGEEQTEGPNWDTITEDGFYLAGEATGATEVSTEWAMAAGVNEVDGTSRDGMYEKYAWLEAGKDFELVLHQAGVNTRYSSALEDTIDGNDGNHADHPTILFKRGALVVGADAPAMRVEETGFYHIVLDLNTTGDLAEAQIILAEAEMGVRGGMNGWGFTAGEMSRAEDGKITWTWKDQSLAKGGEFKFAYGHGWKIQLDDAGKVKANTNLGADMIPGGGNIAVEKAGLYEIVLTFTNNGGAHANSFAYTITCTEESSMPETMYIIGNEFGNWAWDAATVVNMVPVWGKAGAFWAVRYMTTNTEFKFCAVREWNGDFCTLTNNSGFVTPGNNKVEADGLYLIMVDLVDDAVTVSPAAIYGIGDAFGSWDVATHASTVNADGTVTLTTTAAGNLRMYSDIGHGADWWHSEFNVYDGKIVYRGGGNDQAAVTVSAGQTITLDFFNETATIQ